MKTKNIFKALALAMLMPAILLTTACSSDDSIINDEITANKGSIIPVTVNVTRQGDATTRAAYNESTKKLSFSTNDQLFVSGWVNGGANHFAGTLTWQSGGTFSGTIITEETYSGTADALFTAAQSSGYVDAILLPANYGNYGYLSVVHNNGYDDGILDAPAYAIANTKAKAVEQFSFEHANTYSSGFALESKNAILNFTIGGLAHSTNVTATLKKGSSNLVSGEVTTDGSGTATFAMGLSPVYKENSQNLIYDLKDLTLMVGGNDITITTSSKSIEKGHIYNITKSVSQ